jgi:TetR/AcrR family transcriptional regulator, transcriptional repressor for nem operon
MHSETKTKILDLAAHLFQAKGFNAFSYHDIALSLGIKNAAVHYHYPTKESLGLDIIRRARTRLAQLVKQSETLKESPWAQLDLFLNVYRNYLAHDQQVCLLGSVGTDYFTIPESMQQETRLLMEENLDWLSAILQEGRQNGHFSFRGEARTKAMTIATSMAGALQMARITGNDHFQAIEKQLMIDITP